MPRATLNRTRQYLSKRVDHGFAEGFGPELGVAEGVEVGASEVVEPLLEEPVRLVLGLGAVAAGEGGEVDLEEDLHALELPIVVLVHVDVALGMGEYGKVAFGLDAPEDVLHPHWWGEVGGLHEEMVAGLTEGEEVIGLKALLEELVHHVLGGEVEFDGTLVGGLQLGEAGAQALRGVGDVLHDVRRTPHLGDAEFLVALEHFQGGFEGLHAVVHPEEDVRVVVGEAGQLGVDWVFAEQWFKV